MGIVDSIIGAESGGDPNAKNPNSSASGAGQFIDSTWLDVLKSARPDLAQGKTDADLIAMKSDPQLSAQMTAAYADQNGAILSKAGLPVTPGTTYLAHFAGPQGAVKLLQADPGASAADVLGPAALKANPFLQGMTAQDVQTWAAKKMGTAAPQAAPMRAPLPQAPPMFAQAAAPAAAPAQQPQEQQQAAASPMPSFEPPPQMAQQPPMFAQPRKPALTKLMAAFKAPNFYAGKNS